MSETRSRIKIPFQTALDLPPPFRLITLRELGDAFAHARAVAADEGAGTLVFVGRFDLAEFAVVLEPEEPLRTARCAFYAGLNALGDALLARAPPERSITFRWPDAVYVEGGLVGGARLAWPAGADEDVPPNWLVFGATIRTVAMDAEEPSQFPLTSALANEGFDDCAPARVVESFARHLMATFDTWREAGFGAIAKDYLARLVPEKGLRREIGENGDLTMRRVGTCNNIERRDFVQALAVPSWLDPVTGAPRADGQCT